MQAVKTVAGNAHLQGDYFNSARLCNRRPNQSAIDWTDEASLWFYVFTLMFNSFWLLCLDSHPVIKTNVAGEGSSA